MLQIQRFEEQIKKALPEKIYFLFATEPFFLFEAVRLIRKNFNPITIESYEYPEEVDTTALMTTHSLFAEKRILIVSNFEKIKKTEKRIEWLNKVKKALAPPISLIILSNTSTKEIPDELDFIRGERISSFNLDIGERDLEEWISYKASEQGINLKFDAISYLIDITNGQPGLLSSEIEKISLLTEKNQLGLSDIKEILSEVAEYKTFDLIDAIERKDTEKAFKILEQIKTTDADMVLGALNWYYSRKPYTDEKIYHLLYNANLSLRQSRSLSLDLLLYELLKS